MNKFFVYYLEVINVSVLFTVGANYVRGKRM